MGTDAPADSRRDFLRTAAGLGGAAALASTAEAAPAMPTVKFGRAEISRLIIGSNPLYGYSHFDPLLSNFMREYMTQDRRIEVLHRCERAGIRTWQVHYNKQTIEDLQRYRSEGGKMNWFLLGDFEMMTDLSLIAKVAKEFKPIGIAHHGNRTDDRFKAGQQQLVKDFCKAVRDAGVMVGVSAHNPAVLDTIESQNWDVDYYQTCVYRVTRSREEARQEFGESPVDIGGMFMERDPERMCKFVRQTKKPCLAFKILAAGRNTEGPKTVDAAFKFAFDHIKPRDAVIVGMCPKFKDEITENAALAAKYGQNT
jgi:hypothetical protein